MKNKCILMPIGFDLSGVLRVFSEYGLQTGDKIVFVFPSTENERGRATKADIEKTLLTLASRGIKLEYEIMTVNENDFDETLKLICEKVIKVKEYDVFAEITGGLRVICVALGIAAVLMPEYIKKTFLVTETSGKRLSIPFIGAIIDLTQVERDLLWKISSGAATADELSVQLNKDRSTLSRQLESLTNAGLIERSKKGRFQKYKLTVMGEILNRKFENKTK